MINDNIPLIEIHLDQQVREQSPNDPVIRPLSLEERPDISQINQVSIDSSFFSN